MRHWNLQATDQLMIPDNGKIAALCFHGFNGNLNTDVTWEIIRKIKWKLPLLDTIKTVFVSAQSQTLLVDEQISVSKIKHSEFQREESQGWWDALDFADGLWKFNLDCPKFLRSVGGLK